MDFSKILPDPCTEKSSFDIEESGFNKNLVKTLGIQGFFNFCQFNTLHYAVQYIEVVSLI